MTCACEEDKNGNVISTCGAHSQVARDVRDSAVDAVKKQLGLQIETLIKERDAALARIGRMVMENG